MAVPLAAITFLQAALFFHLIVVRRKYSTQFNRAVDKYFGCGIVDEGLEIEDTDEDEDWPF